MASLIKKAPALLATAKEVATPKLNTFWRYAKVGEIHSVLPFIQFNLLGEWKMWSDLKWAQHQDYFNTKIS